MWRAATTHLASHKRQSIVSGQVLAMRANGTLSYILTDHLGSTSVTTDANGIQTSETRYTAFGENRGIPSGANPTAYKYTGQLETSIGLYFYVSRFYDPYLNHWTQPDTIIPDPYNVLDWNRYSYVRYNSIRYTDSTGHMVDDGCRTEGCDIKPGEEYHDYIYNMVYAGEDRKKNSEVAESILIGGSETIVSVLWEPADWAITTRDCLNGECSPFVLLGLLPFIPSTMGKRVDDVVDVVKGLDGVKLPVDDMLDLATEFLGKDYVDMGKGRFLSADGMRQVRMGIEDILGTHPFSGGPHINFELLAPKPGYFGHSKIIQDIHIFIYEVLK